MEGKGIPETGESFAKDQENDAIISDAMRDTLSEDEQRELDKARAIAQGMVGALVPEKYDPKAEQLHDGEHEDSEFGEPGDEESAEFNPGMDDDTIQPYVVTLVFHGAARPNEEQEFYELVKAVCDDAEKRGLYYYHGAAGIFPMDKIAPGTDIHKAVMGHS